MQPAAGGDRREKADCVRNLCCSLGFDDIGGGSHTKVRVWIHGALAGELTIRREERECLKRTFYDGDASFSWLAWPGEMVGLCSAAEDERGRHGFRESADIQEQSFVSIDPIDPPCGRGRTESR